MKQKNQNNKKRDGEDRMVWFELVVGLMMKKESRERRIL